MSTLEQPPQETRHDYVAQIRNSDLPPRVATLADEYDALFADRDRFLWKWIHTLFPAFRLSSVADEHATHVRTQKTILTMYVTVLDDLVEQHGDRQTFREAKALAGAREPDPERAAVDEESFAFIERVWDAFERGIADAPRYEEFSDVFAYDLQQTLTAIDYSGVVNDNPCIANVTGAKRYGAHNMVMFPYADVDLMYSPAFALSDFGHVRDLLWDLQEMARIGNWLTTWEREVAEGDFTAGVVVFAVQEGIVTLDELAAADDPAPLVERIKNHDIEEVFRRRWAECYRTVSEREFDADTVDLDRLVEGMETVFEYHLASEGLK